jgi:hypothetical protein
LHAKNIKRELACASVAFAGNVFDYTYDADGNISDTTTSSATTVQLSANPLSILPGGTATLTWTSFNADSEVRGGRCSKLTLFR